MKVSKREYMYVNERKTVKRRRQEVERVEEFKYQRSTIQNNGLCRSNMKKRVQGGWRRVSEEVFQQK